MKLHNEKCDDGTRTKASKIRERNSTRKGKDLDNWIEAQETFLAIQAEKMNRKHEEKAIDGMPFDGSEY